MYKSTKIRLKERVFSLNTALCVIIGFILLMWFSITNWIQYNNLIGYASFSEMCNDYVNEVVTAHARSGFNLFAPIFAVLPCATVFCDDYNSGYLRAIFPRSAKRKYLSECIICCSLSGGLAVLVPDLLCSIVFLSLVSLLASFLFGTYPHSIPLFQVQHYTYKMVKKKTN